MSMYTVDDLASVTSRIRNSEKLIRDQERLIVRLIEAGRDISYAQSVLDEMRAALAGMRRDQETIAKELGRIAPRT